MYFGCNSRRYSDVSAQVSNMTMVRAYAPPGEWTWEQPTAPTPPNCSPWLSTYPPADDFIAGKLDTPAIAWLKAAPAHGWLTTYHEPQTYKTVTPAQARAIHSHMLELVHEYAPQIRYGAILMQGTNLAQWVIDGLDYYAIDIYENLTPPGGPAAALARNFAQLPAGRRGVAETNSPVESQRPAWFQDVYDWLLANDGHAMCTFWNPSGQDSGPWLPDDTATIDTLNAIALGAKG